MNNLTLLLASITMLIFICFGPRTPEPPKGIDPELKPYIEEFDKQAKKHAGHCKDWKKINIKIADLRYIDPFNLKHSIAGLCNMLTRDIMIDRNFYNSYTKKEIEEVIFHELGHCTLRRFHYNKLKNGTPLSIMYKYTIPEKTYMKYRKYYLKELFRYNHCGKK